MKILAIDTATEACSAALYIDGEVMHEYKLAPREHTQLILPMVERLMRTADLKMQNLDALSYARGPGAFTGVRIAAGVIQGLSYADDIPVVPVSTLAAIAAGVYFEHGHRHVLSAIDARMGEVYWGAYRVDDESIELIGDEIVIKPDQIAEIDSNDYVGAGTGWSEYKGSLQQKFSIDDDKIFSDYLPSAETIVKLAAHDLKLGKQMSAHQAQPVYLRDNVAKKKSAAKQAVVNK